jgi:hypothetical protein
MKNKFTTRLTAMVAILLLIVSLSGWVKKTEATAPATAEQNQSSANVTAPDASPSVEDSGPELKMLDAVALKDSDVTIVVKDTQEAQSDYVEAGNKLLNVWILAKNTGAEPLYINYGPYVLSDTDGTEYEASYYTSGVMYDGAYVLPGGVFEGPVGFEIPDGAAAYS